MATKQDRRLSRIERLIRDSGRASLFQFRFTIGFAALTASLAVALALQGTSPNISNLLMMLVLFVGGMALVYLAVIGYWEGSRRKRSYRKSIAFWIFVLLIFGTILLAASLILSKVHGGWVPYVQVPLILVGWPCIWISGLLLNSMVREMRGGRGKDNVLPL